MIEDFFISEQASDTHLHHLVERMFQQVQDLSSPTATQASIPSQIPSVETIYSTHPQGSTHDSLDIHAIRRDFPIFSQPIVWLDNAATTQKPLAVLQAVDHFLRHEYSNIQRSAHAWARRATALYEQARQTVAQFIRARSDKEIVFVRGTTEGINLIAQTFGDTFIREGDEIILSHLEHHSSILPWQVLAKKKGARLRVIPIDRNGDVLLEEYARLLSGKTKMVALTHVSNAIGTVLPVATMTKMAKAFGAHVLIDAAQSVPHFALDVQALDCDFLVFSGHKIYGPTGIGVVYSKEALLYLMPPYQVGGGVIEDVSFESTTYRPGNAKFEAGTPNITGAIGLRAALEYVTRIGLDKIAAYEKKLTEYAVERLSSIPHLQLIGQPKERVSVVSFVLKDIPLSSVAEQLDAHQIALRIGHHCALPTVRFFGHEETIRPSFSYYNTKKEVDLLVDVIRDLVRQRK